MPCSGAASTACDARRRPHAQCAPSAELERVALGPQGPQDLLAVRLATGLELEPDLDLVDRDGGAGADVLDLQDVGVDGGAVGEQPGQVTGAVGDADPELQVAPGRGHAVTDDP